MNITLINPKLKTWSPNVYPPLGLLYIASVLEQNDYKVKILDMNSHNISDKKLIKELDNTDITGITGMITEFDEVIRLTKVIRRNTSAPIILGGALATTWTEKVLINSWADYAVRGEGEVIILNLIEAIKRKDDMSRVKGIAYKKFGKVIINPPEEPIKDLDLIPFPARHLLDMTRYTTHHFKSFGVNNVKHSKSTTIVSSRGCPFSCIFCYKEMWGYKWRGRSASNILQEIIKLKNDYGFNSFVFNDDTFVMDKERVLEFCQLIKDSGVKFKWYCNGRVNLMNEEVLKAMSESGCVGIAYGIESGTQEILNFIKKGITIEQIENITKLTKKYGIHVTGYFMLGMLGETKETMQATLELARRLDLDFYGFSITTPMQGTPLYAMAQEQGKLGDNLNDWSIHASTNLTKDCTREELEQFNNQAFQKFTMQKKYGKHYLFNPLLWWYGFSSLFFVLGKRDFRGMIRKATQIIFGL